MSTSTMKKITDTVASVVFGLAKDGIAQAHANVAALVAQVEREQAGRQALLASFEPRAGILHNYDTELDSVAEEFATSRARALVGSLSGRVSVAPNGKIGGLSRPVTLQQAIGQIDGHVLVALVPELRAALRRELERVPYLEGPPMAVRPRLIAEADAKIATLRGEHRQLVDAAAELGLTIPDLPENRADRLREQREREQIASFNSLNERAIERGAFPKATSPEEAR